MHRKYKDEKREPSLSGYISEISFYYDGVDIEYDSTDGSPDCDGYVRNSQIINTKVKSVDIYRVSALIADAFKKYKIKIESIDLYCIDRILRINKVYENDNWRIDVVPGYYGEEIGGVYFSAIENVAKSLEECSKLQSLKEKVEYVLSLEYGYVLDVLKDREYVIEEIDRNSVSMLQDHYYKKIEPCSYYKDFKLPICVVLDLDNYRKYPGFSNGPVRYRLIDGYHRFVSSLGNEKITVILAK